ncbi:MAG: aldo/keto reductase [Sphingomonadales bacterium]|nr:aldo/keto reductase [Sphingomonadales bacterium]
MTDLPAKPTDSVPHLGLGCASLGNLYQAVADDAARATIDAAWELGIRQFDTAPYYGLGLSERRVGDALRERERDAFILSSKVGRLLVPEASPSNPERRAERYGFVTPMPFEVRFDYTYDGIMRSYEASLQRLGLSRIDILLVHDIGADTHGADAARHFVDLAGGGYRALDELRSRGDVRAIGLGVNEWQVCLEAMTIGRWDTFLLAGRYTLLEQEPLHTFLPQCAEHGATIILGGAYNSGILATGTRGTEAPHYNYAPAPDDIIARVKRLEAVCDSFGVPLAAAALQFPLAHPVVDCVIPGLGSAARVKTTMDLLETAIPASFWNTLRSEGLIDPAAPLPTAGEAR